MLLPPAEIHLRTKLLRFHSVDRYLEVKQGLITGDDEVFIRRASDISEKDKEVYLPFLPDKEMERYRIRESFDRYVFYPYRKGKLIDENELRNMFPDTWKYLANNKKRLLERKPVQSGDLKWWKPVRPRIPKNILRRKIVCPHLTLTPRFSIDFLGCLAVSHAPFLLIGKDYEAFEKMPLSFIVQY